MSENTRGARTPGVLPIRPTNPPKETPPAPVPLEPPAVANPYPFPLQPHETTAPDTPQVGPHVVIKDGCVVCLNCTGRLHPTIPATIEDFVVEMRRFSWKHSRCLTRPTPDAEPVNHVHIDFTADLKTATCYHCGASEPLPEKPYGEAFRLKVCAFAGLHAGCVGPDTGLLPYPPELQGVPYHAFVYQVWFQYPSGGEWYLWNTISTRVGPVKVWGHPSRRNALAWVAALSEKYDDYAIRIRPVRVEARAVVGPVEVTDPERAAAALALLPNPDEENEG